MANLPRDAFGGLGRRAVAYAVDVLILGLIGAALGFVLGIVAALRGTPLDLTQVDAVFQWTGVLIGWVYFANAESGRHMATPGKRLMGLRVVDTKLQPLSFGRASGRLAGKALSGLLLGVGFLMVAFTDRHQGLHDKLASTLVLRRQS